ncbi:MAG: InlB B-repeat-containing protein, partial [Chitinispirillaceae bacterium]|nr:InlB B-repeat-containing protein [Chitinispirillaceae bacterium]
DQGSLFREGYTFTGWNTAADSSGIDYPHDTTFTIGASSITLYAKWEIKRYTVIFNSQGGSDVPALNDVAHDSLITKPDPDPILMGYTFEGWYEDDGCTNPWDFGSETVTGDDTLYVKWDIKRYTVVFNSQGGIPDTTIQVVKHGNKVTKPADPTKPDSNFVGWFKEAGCVNSWDFNNDSVVANMTLYGKWEIKQYTVVFNSQGGDPDTTMQVINYGNKAAAPDPEPTKLDSNCVGWFKEAECVNQWDFDNDSVVANMTLYGKWKIKQYTVVFNSQGGDPDTTMQLVNHGNKAAAPAPEPTKQDSIFVGWFKESECINQWDFENENVVGDTILYAKWYGYTYTVYFDDQGATTQVNPNSKTVTSPATTINVLPSPPMKTGCNFSGWYTETIGRGTEFTANAEVTEDITVYANWTITDIDGNVYHTVSIGTQTWMVENLKTTRYRDGTPLSRITDPGDWGAISSPKYCWYNNDSTTYNSDYGILYNWYTVSDTNTHRLALSGWHVPSDAEWTILTTYLGGESVAGGELKEADTSHWKSPNTGATNNTGFTARPGGERFTSGLFDGMRYYGFWWSSTEDDATYAWARPIYYGGTMIIRNSYNKHWGFSIRCVRD